MAQDLLRSKSDTIQWSDNKNGYTTGNKRIYRYGQGGSVRYRYKKDLRNILYP